MTADSLLHLPYDLVLGEIDKIVVPLRRNPPNSSHSNSTNAQGGYAILDDEPSLSTRDVRGGDEPPLRCG